jgi:hypothetical protein
VFIDEYSTGIVVNKDGKRIVRNIENQEPWYLVFDTEELAVQFAKEYRLAHPDFECIIEDSSGKQILCLRPD